MRHITSRKRSLKDEFLIATATEIDVLEIMVRFTKQIELTCDDPYVYLVREN